MASAIVLEYADGTDPVEILPDPDPALYERVEASVRVTSWWQRLLYGGFFRSRGGGEADLLPESARYYAKGRRVLTGEGRLGGNMPRACGKLRAPTNSCGASLSEYIGQCCETMGFHADKVQSFPLCIAMYSMFLTSALWIYFELYTGFSTYWTGLWDEDVGDDSGTMSSIFTTATTILLMVLYTAATIPAWGHNHIDVSPRWQVAGSLCFLIWVGFCCAFPGIAGYSTDLETLLNNDLKFFLSYWFLLVPTMFAAVLVGYNLTAALRGAPQRSYWSNKLQAARLYTYLRLPHRLGERKVLERYLQLEDRTTGKDLRHSADAAERQPIAPADEALARRGGRRDMLRRLKPEGMLQSLDRAWFADRKCVFADELSRRLVRIPAIVWTAFLTAGLFLVIVVILAQWGNEEAQDTIQSYIESSETAKKLTDGAVNTTSTVLRFYDEVVYPGLGSNMTAFADAIESIKANVGPACLLVQHALTNVTSFGAALSGEGSAEAPNDMTQALFEVAQGSCTAIVPRISIFDFFYHFADTQINATIANLREVNGALLALQADQEDAIKFWTTLKPALYRSWIAGEVIGGIWTVSFFPSVLYGYRRNVLKVRLGIPLAFTGSEERNRAAAFHPYRSYYFVGAYISCTAWSFILAWFIWTLIALIFAWEARRVQERREPPRCTAHHASTPILAQVFFDFTFVYTRSVWITWITVTIWDIAIRSAVVMPQMFDGSEVKRPRLWSFFCLAETVALFPSCGFKAFMRVFWVLFLAILGQQRVDQGLLPMGCHTYDACFASFIAVLLQDERTASNPIMLTFSDMLLNHKTDAAAGGKRSKAWLKMRSKLWLAWTLVKHPQLRYYRWHYLERVTGSDRALLLAERHEAEEKAAAKAVAKTGRARRRNGSHYRC